MEDEDAAALGQVKKHGLVTLSGAQVLVHAKLKNMFRTAVCKLFPFNLKWPKNKSFCYAVPVFVALCLSLLHCRELTLKCKFKC